MLLRSPVRIFPVFLSLLALIPKASNSADLDSSVNPRFAGTPFVRHWQSEDYQAAPVNWEVTQDPRTGFLYVANNYGLLEFDGTRWRLLEMPNGGPVRSFAIDAAGHGWAGGLGEIAFFAAGPSGFTAPVSLTAQLPPASRTFGNVTRACATPEGVYFTSGRQLLLFAPDQPARSWTLGSVVSGLWWQHDSAHLSLPSGEILHLIRDQLSPAAPAFTSRYFSVFAQHADADGTTLLLTSLGPHRWRGPGHAVTPFSSSAPDPFVGDEPVAATFLPDGSQLFGFLRSGVRRYDTRGHLLSSLNESHGLPSNRIEHLFTDAEGGTWVAQRAGLTRLQFDSRFALHGRAQGLAGSPRVLVRHADRLYIAHNEGVDWRDESTGRFQPIAGLRASISTFTRTDGRLFGVGSSLYEIPPDHRWRAVLPGSQLAIFPLSHQPGTFVAGNTTATSLLRYAGSTWTNLGPLDSIDEGVTRFRDGGDGTVWGVAYNGSGIWRFDHRADAARDSPARRFTPADGLPPTARRDSPRIARLGAEIFVTGATGTRRFDPANHRFVRDLGIENFSADLGAVALTVDDTSPWWLTAPPDEKLGRLVPGERQPWRFAAIPSGQIRGIVPNSIFHDDATHTVWIAGQGLLVSADLAWQSATPRPPLRAFIRQLLAADHHTPLDPAQPLPPQHDSVRLLFSAPTYEADFNGKPRTLFRTRLEGLDADWSEWSDATFRDFTNLPYRRLIFHVQARALDGRESAPTQLAFAIAPPWWLEPWVRLLYALGALLAITGVVRWRTRALHRRTLQLETVVATRTAELARLRQIDRDESIAAKLAEEKARLETLRYQLNPHFLYNALNSIRALIYKRPPAAGDMVQQLADLCRITLTRHEALAPLRDEFAMLRLYLEMEKTRWGDLLEIKVTSTPDADAQLLPPFLLLPLVENALKHGREVSPDVLQLHLTAHCAADRALVIEIANSGAWITPGTGTSPSTGIGLENLRERLRRYYPDTHEFTVTHADNWVRATLRLPLDSAAFPPTSTRFPGEESTPTSSS